MLDIKREGDVEQHHRNEKPEVSPKILIWSAHTRDALERSTEQLATYLAHSTDNIADIAYTLQMGQRALPWRGFVVANTTQEAAMQLEAAQREKIWQRCVRPVEADLVFLFPGSGTQQLFMGQVLYRQEPVFRRIMDQCAEHMRQRWQYDLLRYLYPAHDELAQAQEHIQDPGFALSALFCVEYALAQLWLSWGVQPKALLGHSLGEYMVATLAGVLSWHDALDLITQNSLWMAEMASGTTAIVPLPYKSIVHEMEKLDLTAINAPSRCVVSGEEEDIAALEAKLAVRLKRLSLQIRPHSRLIEPMMELIRDFAAHLTLRPPRIPYVSNVTGTWITKEQATDPGYWAQHLRSTVLFSQGLQTLLERPRVFVEVGPGTALTTLVKRQGNHEHVVDVVSSLPHPHSDSSMLSHAIGRLWCAGVAIDWTQFHTASENPQRLSLPFSFDTV